VVGETFGSYRVTGKIGEGGMGAVYLAEHTLLGRKAAVKVLLPEHSRNQDLINRFFNEAKTAAGLKHPALVDVFDYGVHPDGSAYLVMDFLEGESLGSRLQRVAPLPPEQAADLSRQIARGMEAAHSQGIVHRDLKPDNIFLVPDAEDPTHDQVKILDFGIAKLLGNPSASKGATSTGMVLGTPLFMAPEQCKGAGVVDHRADIYSLGCIMYLMLCARPPFEYEGVGEILGAHLHEPVTPPRSINPTIPEALEAIVLKALAKKPEERYQTMAALAVELGRLLGIVGATGQMRGAISERKGGTVVMPPAPTTLSKAAASPTPAAPAPAPAPRRSLALPIAGAILFLAGGGLAAFALLRPQKATTPPVVTPPRLAVDAARVVVWHDAAPAVAVVDAAVAADAAIAVTEPDAAAVVKTEPTAARRRRTCAASRSSRAATSGRRSRPSAPICAGRTCRPLGAPRPSTTRSRCDGSSARSRWRAR
jgi:eukaryotic-like serine/threonine-protein kinase